MAAYIDYEYYSALYGDKAVPEADFARLSWDAEKAIKGYLSPLDEINKYDSNTSSSSGAGASGSTGVNPSDMFETVEIEDKISGFADRVKQTLSSMFAPLKSSWDEYGDSIKDTLSLIGQDFADFGARIGSSSVTWFQNLDWSPLMKSVDNLLASLEPLTDTILDGLGWAWENILLPLGQWTIEEALPSTIDLLSAAIDLFTTVLERLKPFGEWLWDNFLQPLGEWVGDAVVEALQSITDILSELSDVINGDLALEDFIDNLSTLEVVILAIAAVITAWTVVQAILNTVLASSPLTWIVLAITAVIAAIVLAITWLLARWRSCPDVWTSAGTCSSGRISG